MGTPFGGEVAGELDEAGFGGVGGGADEALEEHEGSARGWGGLEVKWKLTRLAMVPLMDAMMAMLPPRPCRIISFATACAVMKTPVMLT